MGFAYLGQELGIQHKGGFLPLSQLVAADRPCFVYDGDFILERLGQLKKLLPSGTRFHYAMKANSFGALLGLLQKQGGIGVDVVSGGEIQRALECGFKGQDIVFSGVGKSRPELELALRSGVQQINVESLPELRRIGQIAEQLKVRAPIALRLNPDVDVATHPYIKTGFRDNKFGIDESQLKAAIAECRTTPSVELVGLAVHLGSLMMDPGGLVEALRKLTYLAKELESQGVRLNTLDIGGGWGLDYYQEAQADMTLLGEFASQVSKALSGISQTILFEPGRILVARAGVLLTQIQYVKDTPFKRFVIVDSGIHHLIRPALYHAYHRILPLRRTDGPKRVCDVVGPLCESSDTLGRDRELPELQEGDWLAICDTGAYGSSMSSRYNLRAPADEKLIVSGRLEEQ